MSRGRVRRRQPLVINEGLIRGECGRSSMLLSVVEREREESIRVALYPLGPDSSHLRAARRGLIEAMTALIFFTATTRTGLISSDVTQEHSPLGYDD